jgi:hypothetical protein
VFERKISRRELLRRSGIGLGALALGRHLLGSSAALAAEPGGSLQLARVKARTPAEAFAISMFDDTHRRFADGSIELLLWPGDRQRLAQMGIWHRITETDLVARDAQRRAAAPQPRTTAGPPGADTRTDYRRLADYESEMAALPTQFPGLARRITLPEKTLEGRNVYGIEIGADVDGLDGRPIFYIDGIHHAREWPTAEYVMSFAHHLLRSYGTNPQITALLQRARVTAIPVMNVDGFHYARESTLNDWPLGLGLIGQGQYWRKNRRGHLEEEANGNPSSYGTDPNRNYPFFWGATNRGLSGIPQDVTPDEVDPVLDMIPVLAATSPNPYDQTYYGTAPLSEPESRNVAGYIRGRNVVAVVSNHNNAQLVLRPWGHTTEPAYDESILAPLGTELAEIMFRDETRSQIGLGLYPTTGTTSDWAYGSTSALGYTFEHEGSDFHPPYNDFDGPGRVNNWTKAMSAFVRVAEVLTETANHGVIRGRATDGAGNPVPATLQIHKEFDTPMWPEGADGIGPLLHEGADVTHEVIDMTTTTRGDGLIEWHVNPSTRPLEASAGRLESYKLKITANGSTKEIDAVLRRGDILNLGDLTF